MTRKDLDDKELWVKMAAESAYDVVVLTQKMEVSRRQLQRWSQVLFRKSPQEWLNEQRLIRARS